MGAVKVIKKYFRQISKVENANIILFSTVAVTQGMPFHASISSAKGAIEGLTRSLAGEFAGKIKSELCSAYAYQYSFSKRHTKK